MKNHYIPILFIILLAILYCQSSRGEEVVRTNIEVTEDAINYFVNHQYNRAGFPQEIHGNELGIEYDITLNLPFIRLLNNQAKIEFGFRIESNIFNGTVEFEDNVAFIVPSIEDLTVKAISQSFVNRVNSLNIHTVLKNAIIATWQSLELEAYPMKLAKIAENTEWIAERNISVIEPYFSVSFNIESGKINIGLNTYLNGEAPLFTAYLTTKEDYENGVSETPTPDDYFHFYSPIKVTLKEIEVHLTNVGRIYKLTPNVVGSKKEKTFAKLDYNRLNPGNFYIVKVLYETGNTFYMRQYEILCSVGYTHNGVWFYDFFAPSNALN